VEVEIGGALAEGWRVSARNPTSRKEREKWGTQPFWPKKQNFLDDLSNSARPFDYIVKGRARAASVRSGALMRCPHNSQCSMHLTHLHKENTMRFMMIMFPKEYLNAKPGWAPDLKSMEAMGKYNEELGKAGVLLALDGLTPPATMSARVTFKGGKSKVTDGPFTEAKEVVGGYWIIQVKSREEALEWASRIPGKDNEMVEVRRMFDMTDFDPETQEYIQKKFGNDVAAEMRQ
jgi:hypothetical protein